MPGRRPKRKRRLPVQRSAKVQQRQLRFSILLTCAWSFELIFGCSNTRLTRRSSYARGHTSLSADGARAPSSGTDFEFGEVSLASSARDRITAGSSNDGVHAPSKANVIIGSPRYRAAYSRDFHTTDKCRSRARLQKPSLREKR